MTTILHVNFLEKKIFDFAYRFEEGDTVSTDVSRWSKTETTDETSSKIGEDITVKVGHDEHVVLGGILDDLRKKNKLGLG